MRNKHQLSSIMAFNFWIRSLIISILFSTNLIAQDFDLLDPATTLNLADRTSIRQGTGSSARTKRITLAQLQAIIGGGGGSGSVTSVGFTAPSTLFSVSGSPLTSSGTIGLTYVPQTANTILAAPNGTFGSPSFRLLVSADIPSLDAAKITSGTFGDSRISSAVTWNAKISDITGLISQGTNVSITGSGTSGSPFVINATGTAPVTSVFGRTVAVTAQSGDYNTSLVTESGNLYYTDARARAAISVTLPLTYALGVLGSTAAGIGNSGHVTNSAQIFGGVKSFFDGIKLTSINTYSGDPALSIQSSGTTADFFQIEAGTPTKLKIVGASVNVDMRLEAKGTGKIDFNSPTKFSSLTGTETRVMELDALGNPLATARLSKILYATTAQVSTTSGLEVEYGKFTIPAGRLSKDGDAVLYTFTGYKPVGTGSASVKFQFGTNVAGENSTYDLSATKRIPHQYLVTRINNTGVVVTPILYENHTTSFANGVFFTPDLTTTATDIRVQLTGADVGIFATSATVEFKPAP